MTRRPKQQQQQHLRIAEHVKAAERVNQKWREHSATEEVFEDMSV